MRSRSGPPGSEALRLFLCGDVMTGRGIDQVLPHPGDPRIHESTCRSAEMYVALAEQASGPIPRPVSFADIWGDALEELAHVRPDARIINLETAITRSDDYWRDKGVHYRMNPDNIPCLTAARVDCCVLANNHTLDYGRAGLCETRQTLRKAGVASAGAGRDLAEARAPAVIDVAAKGRVVVFAFGTETSGILPSWAATADRPGVNLLHDLSDDTIDAIRTMVRSVKRRSDVVIASIHWGGNWGFAVPAEHVRFAHGLVEAGVDIVHGHSSHHVRPLEVFDDRLILYGCGDFIDDYEGIQGYEGFRDDLVVMYFPTVDTLTGRVCDLRMTPMRLRRLRVNRALPDDVRWLLDTLNRESRRFDVCVELDEDGRLALAQRRRDQL